MSTSEECFTPLQKTIRTMAKNNSVSHPSHYTNGDIECIDAIEASMSFDEFCGYLKGNVLKYLWRYKLKNNPVEDLEKANWYLSKLIDIYSNHVADRFDP